MSIAIEISYSRTFSPSLVGPDSDDKRIISVGYKRIDIINSTLLVQSKNISSKIIYIFGFYAKEIWGTWSQGGKSLVIIDFSSLSHDPFDLLIDAHPFLNAFRSCIIKIKTSLGHCGKAEITGSGPIKITLKKPLICRSRRLVVGDFSRIQSPSNLSGLNQTKGVSIIILNHERHQLTRLAAVAAASSGIKIPFEIICMDTGSSAEDLACLCKSEVPMKIIELSENKGFGALNNLASQEASGEYLLFLNNDAFLDEGAVAEMLKTFLKKPDCRISGAVLRAPDGTMQEAGATLQGDGHPIRNGRNTPKFNPRKLPRFQPVDYVSGACLMIRKSDFLQMGGFDEKYSPAYYEDTDLCMRTLLYGQKVYLASRANCYHIENATTSAIEDGAWATRTAEAHREIFLKDWGSYLASREPKDLPRHLAQ